MKGVALVADGVPVRDRDLEDSFLLLLNHHQGVMHRIARAYSSGPADEQDLFQDMVHQLWRSYPRYRHESSTVTWVYRVALNTAITSARRRACRPTQVPIESAAEPVVAAPQMESREVAELYRAIRQLSDVERALVMCYLEDFSYRRIGGILGISESNVGVRLTRVKAKLQRLIAKTE